MLRAYSPCHPAGIIGGNTYGVAKNVTLYSVKVFSNSPSTNLTQILQAVQWVQNNAIKPAGAAAWVSSNLLVDVLTALEMPLTPVHSIPASTKLATYDLSTHQVLSLWALRVVMRPALGRGRLPAQLWLAGRRVAPRQMLPLSAALLTVKLHSNGGISNHLELCTPLKAGSSYAVLRCRLVSQELPGHYASTLQWLCG